MLPFIEYRPLFHTLPYEIRKILIKENLIAIGSFNSFFIAKEMNIFDNEICVTLIDNKYGNDQSNSVIQASRCFHQNGTLIKILLMLIGLCSAKDGHINY